MDNPKRPSRDLAAAPEHVRGLWLLADLAGKLASLDSPKLLQEEVLEHALQMFQCASGAVLLWDAESGRFRLGPAVGKVHTFRPEDVLGAEPVRTTVLGAQQPLLVPDPGRTLGSALGGWHGMAVVPIAGASSVLGLLLIGDRADGRAFTPTDTALMATLGSVVATALETHLALAAFRQEMGRRMTEAMAELTRAAAELQRLKTFNEDLFESAPVGIIVFDRDFRVTFRNSAADRLWPDDRSVIAAARRTDVARRDPDWETGLRDVIHMQRGWLAEAVTFERPGREAVRVDVTCSPLLAGKRDVIGGVLVVEDVTQRVHMQRRLEVSERLAGVGRLAAVVAHEINNPLDGIIRLVNLARRAGAEGDGPRGEKYLAEAHKGLLRLVRIVRDLLDFSRSASGSVEPMPIREILAEASQSLAAAAEKAGVRIAIDCDAALPPLRSGTLFQVVLNLMKNAIEAMPAGGRIDVRARTDAGALVIDVSDTGPGLAPEVLAHLFEPFYTLKAIGKGTGLGLVISKDLVEKQGGSVTAANRPKGGAVFTVRIPLGAV